uniref:thymidine kinase n=1 Tax=viral metagenome TaxID=1070528 RepID=A0A6C0BDY1_9ZZZZ
MSLIIYSGCMFSSKTKTMLSKLSHLMDIFPNKKAILITSIKDTRGKLIDDINKDIEIYNFTDGVITEDASQIITSHSSLFNGIPRGTNALIRTLYLKDVNVSNFDIIAVDEGQFFTDLYDSVKKWVDGFDKYVLVASLDSNFKREPFGEIHKLIPICNEFHKMKGNCRYCIRELGDAVNMESLPLASFTARITDSEEEILTGGMNDYEATCRRHHPYSKEIKNNVKNGLF